MKKGKKLIWNSGFGYDIVIYEKECISTYLKNCSIVKLQTGSCIGSIASIKNIELFPYTINLLNIMIKRYGYEKI